MKYFPVFLDVTSRPCLVVGGGRVAFQKVQSLLRAGAQVTVISPRLVDALSELADAGEIRWHGRPYRDGDLDGFCLAFAATDDATLHQELATEARRRGVLLNVVDVPALCDFIVPSLLERGDLLIATSTSGSSPAMAQHIRRQLEAQFGPEYDIALRILRRVRERLAALPSAERQQRLHHLVASPLIELVREGRDKAVDALLQEALGPQASLQDLGVALA
jgi:precorrin-2 dehydrogenase/sirohydrochlorin ferrochelatase